MELGLALRQALLQEAADDGGTGQLFGQRCRSGRVTGQCVEAQFEAGVLFHVAGQRFDGFAHGQGEQSHHSLPMVACRHGRIVVDADLDGIPPVHQGRKTDQALAGGRLQFQQFGQRAEIPAGVPLAGAHDGVRGAGWRGRCTSGGWNRMLRGACLTTVMPAAGLRVPAGLCPVVVIRRGTRSR